MMMPAGAMYVPVGKLLLRRLPHLHDFDIEVQDLAREGVIASALLISSVTAVTVNVMETSFELSVFDPGVPFFELF